MLWAKPKKVPDTESNLNPDTESFNFIRRYRKDLEALAQK
jgi:hypothetical protein